ncbi:MAG TPA: hypothetical protein VME92_20965 [Acetobacteraceae bacterium]|nr:hypothetical protein [Acetobacteraceae bacterium]
MRKTLLVSATMFAMAMALPAMAQTTSSMNDPSYNGSQSWQGQTGGNGTWRPGHEPGIGPSEPSSSRASNIDQTDTRSEIAPRLPTPAVGQNADAATFLHAAQQALWHGRTGEAQSALERAETALLNRDEVAGPNPTSDPAIGQINQALQALAHHDMAGAHGAIQEAMRVNNRGPMVGSNRMENGTYGTGNGAGIGAAPGGNWGAGASNAGQQNYPGQPGYQGQGYQGQGYQGQSYQGQGYPGEGAQ